jgi:cryptochrome
MRTLLWFRKALRLHDNRSASAARALKHHCCIFQAYPALPKSFDVSSSALAAAVDCGSEVFPVFILDPHFIGSGCVGSARMTFLFDALADLHSNLQQRSSTLFCLRGSPEHVIPKLFKQWNITRLAYEYDSEPYAKSRDLKISSIAQAHGVEVVVR